MIAYLLCAGFGTRMHPLTEDTPKSLLPVAGRPMVDYLLDDLAEWAALEAIHVAVNHRDAASFYRWANRWQPTLEKRSISIQVHDDRVTTPTEQLGAVGDLQFLLKQTGIPSDGALVSGGDSLYRFPLSPLLNGFAGTTNRVLALYEPDPARRRQSSILQLDGPRVVGLVESPDESPSERICPSWHLLTPDALNTIPSYLETGYDPDTLGTFIDVVAQTSRVEALRLPEHPHLRLHCNTPEDLDTTRRILADEPRLRLKEHTIRRCMEGDPGTPNG